MLRAWGVAYRGMVRDHPHAVGLLWSRPLAAYRAQREAAERSLLRLQQAGLSPDAARLHLRAALVLIGGFCQIEATTSPLPPGVDEALRAEGFPLLGGLVGRVGRDGDELFGLVMDTVVQGVRGALPAPG
jgi:hypothetical protein